jgi:4-hydroxybenzoyl-CoA thioesterase
MRGVLTERETVMPTLINRRTVRIAWGDCDPAQIVFYPRYFGMFDESTHDLFRAALGMAKPAWTKKYAIVGIPMVDTRAKFMIPSTYGEDIVFESQVTAFRKSSFDVVHRVHKAGALAMEGFETRVWVEADATRPGGLKGKPIPADVINAFDRVAL